MKKHNSGLVYTNDKCIGCNRCIMVCPVPGANRSVVNEGKNKIIVDPSKCIHCGNCIRECRHHARDFVDDTEAFINDLGNKDISVIFAPSFFLLYPDVCGKIINFLLSNGINAVYDGSIGADIAVWAGLKFLDEHPEGGYVFQSCPSFINFARMFSKEIFKRILPVQSPAVCSAVYIHKYLKNTDSLAFVGPCISKKDEFDSPETNGEISYSITFDHLMKAFAEIDLSQYSNEFKGRSDTLGVIASVEGGIKRNIANYLSDDKFVLSVDNGVYYLPYYEYYEEQIFKSGNVPYVTDIATCEHGCIYGPGVGFIERNRAEIVHDYVKIRHDSVNKNPDLYSHKLDHAERKKGLYEKFKKLDPADFERKYVGKFARKQTISPNVIDEIFNDMYKTSEEDRCVDCGSCGYGTCREMAEAIALGYNRKDNCVYYEKEENKRLYLTDIMTGIPNISYFNAKLAELIKHDKGGKYAVISFSLKDWELVNERFTYAEGDKTIIEFAKIVEKMAGPGELVAHHGGVDFLAVIEKDRLETFLDDIQNICVHPNDGLKEIEYPASITAGIYMMNDYERVAETVVGRTNIAAANAKTGTPKIVIYDKSMKEELLETLQLIKAFPEALKKEDFLVFYQPKIDAVTSIMHGAEALVRWRSKKGLISPAKFIPLFEKNGLISHLDFYMLEHVCKDLRMWLDKGITPVCISVNFSKIHFQDERFAERIEEIVDKYEIPHEYIEIEITESAYEETKDNLREILKVLNGKGFSTSIDDFGAGYSSLNLLSQLDFQVLKLDKAFLDSGIEEEKVKNVVDSVISMAKKLDMKVVAEGVERKEELELLRRLSCDLIQGYYFDRPIPMSDFKKRLKIPDYYRVE